jgi:hypothetical protein
MNDDAFRAAIETRRWLATHENVRAAFRSVVRSPLANLIDRYVNAYPTGPFARQLRDIARLNAGTLVELDDPDFQEFVRDRTNITSRELASLRCLLAYFDKHGNDVAQDLGLRAASFCEMGVGEQ